MTTESLDAMTDFLIALDHLGPHMEAVGRLCCAAVELQRWGTSMDLQIHNLTREEYDSFEGEDRLFPPTEQQPRAFWSKKVMVYEGNVDHDHEPHCEGGVTLTLYTDSAPTEEYQPLMEDEDPNEGLGFDPTLYGNGASQEPTQHV